MAGLILAISAAVAVGMVIGAVPKGNIGTALIVIGGQSNAISRASTGNNAARLPVDGIYQVARAALTPEPIIPAYEPLQHWEMTPMGVGFGFAFAKHYMADHPASEIVIVPGASILSGLGPDEWGPGGYLSVDLAKRVNQVSGSRQISDCIFLWHQGEAAVVADNMHFTADLVAAFDAMKAEAPALNDCTFLVGGLADDFIADYGAAGARIAAALHDIPQTTFVSTEGLETMDGIHFTAAAQIELGARYYDALN